MAASHGDLAIDEFDDDLIKSMIEQSGFSREDFYGSTKAASKKLNLRWKRRGKA